MITARRPTAARPSLFIDIFHNVEAKNCSAAQIGKERNRANSKSELAIPTVMLTHLRNPEIRPPPLDDVNNLQA
jgi:hypothetical protein